MPRTSKPAPARPPSPAPQPSSVFYAAIPSRIGELEPVITRVLEALEGYGCVNGQRPAIETALREALANAILHGNRSNPRKRVEVECFVQKDESVLLVVRDQGRGFDPSKVKDPTRPENIRRPGGRGIFLIRCYMDEVRFLRGGKEIRMKKNH